MGGRAGEARRQGVAAISASTAHVDLLRRAGLALPLSVAAAAGRPDRRGFDELAAAGSRSSTHMTSTASMSATRSIRARTCSTAPPSRCSSSAVKDHPRCNINYDPSHFLLQQLDYLAFIDIYHERIKAFHVKDAEFNPTGRQGVYSRLSRAGSTAPAASARWATARSISARIFSKLAALRLSTAGRCSNGNAASSIRRTARPKARLHPAATSSASPRRRSTISPAGSRQEAGQAHAGDRSGIWQLDARRTTWLSKEAATRKRAGASGSAWSAAGRAPSSAPCTASPRAWTTSSSSSPARCRRDPARAKASAAELGLAPDRIYGSLSTRWRRPRPARPDGIEAVADRHAEPRPCAGRQGLPRGRHPRHLRQAADDHAGRGEEAGGARRRRPARSSCSPTTTPAIRWSGRRARWWPSGELGEIRIVQAEYPQDWLTERPRGDRPEAGGVAHRSQAVGRRRLRSATSARTPTTSPRFVSGLRARRALPPISTTFVPGPPARRQCPRHAALQGRRAQGHALGEPGGARQRERAEAARLRHEGRARMDAGRSELSLVHAVRPAEAADHPRRRRRRAGGGARHAACRPAIPKAISKASPTSTRKRPAPSARRAGRRQAGQGRGFPTVAGRRRRHGLHRGLRAVLAQERGLVPLSL